MTTVTPEELALRCSKTMWEKDKASQHLGISIVTIRPGSATLQMQVTEKMLNGYAICHGGYIFALADSCFAFSCNTYNNITVAQGCSIEYLKAVPVDSVLVATGFERRRNKTTGVYDIEVRIEQELIALFRGKSFALGKPIF
ncbi:MAG: hydroxyphenylacetyl-CoA thioesterase PaaI [Methylacidiphilales bacterium]|nr:hydroxyphenylacetyl-CoA thioesterase PaaI [Candidatus Methylacidiphilales bacterium]